ncbi:MAG TPA: hypothetical protein VHT24_11230 [Pseudacidobacterium sp.]|jgi:hypothetical protein|nr:hypothetical protein [Pseudacidobacterium sp.]
MSFQTPSILEIDHKLREDFRRRLKDFGIAVDVLDPVLSVIFRTFAHQIESVYANTGRIRETLLDELISGVKLPHRHAHPAQTVIRFISAGPHAKVLRAGTELNARASTGERLSFGTDVTIELSPARIAFALVYQEQRLQLLPGVDISEQFAAYRPSYDPVRINLGPQPAIFLATEDLVPTHLSRHGLFFDLSAGAYSIQQGLATEPWWFFSSQGDLSSEGLMRPRRANRGVSQLEWQLSAPVHAQKDATFPDLSNGFYAGRIFVFPDIKEDQRLLCGVPRLLDAPLARITGRDLRSFFDTPRAWIKIPLPPNVPALHTAIHNIVLHATTASNLFCQNQTVYFEKDGFSIPISRDQYGLRQMLVAPLSVIGLENEIYRSSPGSALSPSDGWFELTDERITLHPGVRPDGSPQEGANIRLWLTNGELGNLVAPGDITGFSTSATFDQIRVNHLAAAAGGTDGEIYSDARRRFADALLTRGRIVTRADLESATLGFDRRILAVDVRSEIERGEHGLHRVERLWVTLDADGFTRPDLELPVLQQELKVQLASRMMHGTHLDVQFEWKQKGASA